MAGQEKTKQATIIIRLFLLPPSSRMQFENILCIINTSDGNHAIMSLSSEPISIVSVLV